MNLLAIDYGTRRIGLSVATTPLAEPLGIITNSKNPKLTDTISDAALDHIKNLIDELHIEKILVGISEGSMADKSRAFILKLKNLTPIPIEEIDETLSSVDADLHMQHMTKKKKHSGRDHIAATLMLQEYLDLHTT